MHACMFGILGSQKRELDSLELELEGCYLCGCWESNSGPLQEQVPLATKHLSNIMLHVLIVVVIDTHICQLIKKLHILMKLGSVLC